MDGDFAQRFAQAWASAWNDRDLDRILSHYAEEVEFHSPRIAMVTGRDLASVRGKAALRAYWAEALARARDLFFEVEEVFVGSDALTLVYTNHRAQRVAETFVFGRDGQVVCSVAAYA